MSDLLYRALLGAETELVNDVLRQLRHSTSRRYMEMEWNVLQHRVEALVAHFVMSVAGTPTLLASHVVERVELGPDEAEAVADHLLALHVLEEQALRLTAATVPRARLVDSLSRVSAPVATAKDRLAGLLVGRARRDGGAVRGRKDQPKA